VKFNLTKFEKHLKIALESLRALRNEAEGRELPRWESVVGLDRELSIMIAHGFTVPLLADLSRAG